MLDILPDDQALRFIARHLGFTVVQSGSMFTLYIPNEGRSIGTMSATTWLDHIRRMMERGQRC